MPTQAPEAAGVAEPRPGIRQCISERFWSHVAPGGDAECWMWLAARHPKGYGAFHVIRGGEKRALRAHRFAYMDAYGPIRPAIDHVLHRCDQPACVNPRHLWLGDNAANMADRDAKGRCHATISSETVAAIRYEAAMGDSCGAIARRRSLSKTHVWEIVTWRIRIAR